MCGDSGGEDLLEDSIEPAVRRLMKADRPSASSPQVPVPTQSGSGRTLSRARKKVCFAPSGAMGGGTVARTFGQKIAEAPILIKYWRDRGGYPVDVFFDLAQKSVYLQFMAWKHPAIPPGELDSRINAVPDILETRNFGLGKGEFYEIKPWTPSGQAAGRAKLDKIDKYMAPSPAWPHWPPLLYGRGDSWSPGKIKLPMPSATILRGMAPLIPLAGLVADAFTACGEPEITLDVKLSQPGLLLYRLCIEADFDCLAKVAAAEVVALLILLAIVVAVESAGTLIPAIIEALPELGEVPALIESLPSMLEEIPFIEDAPSIVPDAAPELPALVPAG